MKCQLSVAVIRVYTTAINVTGHGYRPPRKPAASNAVCAAELALSGLRKLLPEC